MSKNDLKQIQVNTWTPAPHNRIYHKAGVIVGNYLY